MSVASRAILSNFFREQGRQNHPQYLSGLSRALFPTTFLETAVYESDVSQEYTYLGTQTSSLVSLDFRSNHVLFIFDDNPDFTNLCM